MEQLNRLTAIAFCTKQNYYNNFTSDAKIVTISQTGRKYIQFELTPAFVANGQAFSIIKIHGLSFLYNQIRKMVAAISLVARLQCPPAWLSRALTGRAENKTAIPTAPGEYLMLIKQEFSGHANSEEVKLYGEILSNREEINKKAMEFRAEKVLPQILKTEKDVWESFNLTMDQFSEKVDGYELAKQTILREIEIGKKLAENKVTIEVQMKADAK